MVTHCLACSSHQVPAARAAITSLLEFHPGADVLVCAVGPHDDWEGVELIAPEALGFPNLTELRETVSVDEIAQRLRPLLLQHALERGAGAAVLLHPEAEVVGSLEPMLDALSGADLVLLKRVRDGFPNDGLLPDADALQRTGLLEDAMVAAGPGAVSSGALGWWMRAEHITGAHATRPARLATLMVAPGAARVVVLDDAGLGYSAFNAHERTVEERDGVLLADGLRLRLVSFAGFRADRPYSLRTDATRVQLLDVPGVARLAERRAARMLAAKWRPPGRVEPSRQHLADGTRYDHHLRTVHRRMLERGFDPGDLSTGEGAAALLAFARAPAGEGRVPSASNYVRAIIAERPDVVAAYTGDDDTVDPERILEWMRVHGIGEMDLDPAMLPEASSASAAAAPVVEVAGFLDAHLGLGQAGRAYAHALRAAGVVITTRNITTMLSRPGGEWLPRETERAYEGGHAAAIPDVSLICVNAPELLGLDPLDRATLLDPRRYRIGVWAWETDVVPAEWHDAFDGLDELWVYSRYVRDVLAPVSPVPVFIAPLCMELTAVEPGRLPAGVPADGVVFLSSFDLYSTVQRKNPLGSIAAFTRAFAPGEGPTLVIKTINGADRPEALAALRAAVGERPDIVLLDAKLPAEEQAALIDRADCFVSLHRSEGWGLGPAEALGRGKAVVATAYGGVLDFLTPDTAYLVPCTVVPVGSEVEIYPPDGQWAEPDLDAAAAAMRRVVDHPDQTRERAEAGRAAIHAKLSPERVGALLRARLEAVVAPALARRSVGASHLPEAIRDRQAERDALPALVALGGQRFGRVPPGAWSALQRRHDAAARAQDATAELVLQQRAALMQQDAALGELGHRTALLLREVKALKRDARNSPAVARPAWEVEMAPDTTALEELRRLSHGSRAVPFVDDPAIELYDAAHFGRVLGFRSQGGVAARDRYRAFEDSFRGSRDRVASMMSDYLPILDADAGPVLEIGSGRGEFVALLQNAGVAVRGTDPDAGMVAAASEAGVELELIDARQALAREDDATLGTIFASHVIEHLPPAELLVIVDLARAKLRLGGRLVVETVNPHAAHALKTFWVDLTHQHPIFPEVALAIARGARFSEAYVTFPGASGDVEVDRFVHSSWAMIATR